MGKGVQLIQICTGGLNGPRFRHDATQFRENRYWFISFLIVTTRVGENSHDKSHEKPRYQPTGTEAGEQNAPQPPNRESNYEET